MNEKKNIKDIISLLDAGYSREEIADLLEQPEETAEPAAEPDAPEEPEQAEAPAAEPQKPAESAEIQELKKEIQSLKAMIQKQNIKQARIEEPARQESASDILARLVNPNYGMDGGKIR